jgi:hypothetical protein
MFTKGFTKAAALILSLFALTGFASAQYDFTGMDIAGMYNSYVQQQNAQMEVQLQQIIAQVMQDPRFQSMYQQYIMSGGTATAEQYAYSYAATGGFTPQGMQIYQNSEALSAAKIQNAWNGYQSAVQGYQEAYNNYTGSFAETTNEMGNVLMGNSTYVDYATGSSYVLPHTWQTETYNYHNGQTYYVDYAGQYFMVDPNNSDWMYPLTPWQPGQ